MPRSTPPKSKSAASSSTSPVRPSVSSRSSWNTQRSRRPRPKAVDFFSESEKDDVGHRSGNESQEEDTDTSESEAEELDRSASSEGPRNSEDGSESSSSEGEDEDEVADADVPRISQWVDDEMIDGSISGGDSDSEGTHKAKADVQMWSLQDDLSTLPLGVLRKAQRSLGQARALSDSESASTSSESEESEVNDSEPFPSISKEGKQDSQRQKKELAKRPHKHAPTEVSSKRPVSRRRTVVEDNTPKPRDPRFLHARKLLANSPRDLRPAREEEVKRLEMKRERVESRGIAEGDARLKSRRGNRVKGAWFMKRCASRLLHLFFSFRRGSGCVWPHASEKKDLLNKARYDAIAASGGSQAVKKAIEKKQKKISQKEKKSRPFAKGAFGQEPAGANTPGRKRSAGSADDTNNKGAKRRRVS
ncbi:hypothetical protein EDD16DRAFT_1544282 [Pisolithus croceorrhizus]|nr:hypothetical protein EDD16DRAFT_1544282 [Pisolithus croceorrhizus]